MDDIEKCFTHHLIMPNLDCEHPLATIHTPLFDVAYDEHDLKNSQRKLINHAFYVGT
jgi:hypothetical protein